MEPQGQLSLYLVAETPQQFLAGARAVLEQLGVLVASLRTPQEAIDTFCSMLAQDKRQWLLLVDNVGDPSIVEGCLPPAVPGDSVASTRC